MTKRKLVKMDKHEQDFLLNTLYIYHKNDPIEICDPYYTPPVKRPYTDDIDWEAKLEEYNNVYSEEIKQDELRYQLHLDMLEVKKEMETNPLIFDKEEEFYETDPHKLVNFDEVFTPFFDKESNDVFFHNLKNPLRLKWEEIPEEDRKQKIVHFDQSIKKLQYDEVELYFNKYLINKDIVLLFLKFMPDIWPISTFLGQFESYVNGMDGKQMYEFFIKRVIILGSSYDPNNAVEPITDKQREVTKYMKEVYRIKAKLFKELLACIKVKPVRLLFKSQETPEEILKKSDFLNSEFALNTDILTSFIQKYQLYVPHKNREVIRVYNYPEISKFIILLNLSFFNIFPISTEGYEEIRPLNRELYISFLWYLKDFFWEGHQSTLQVKQDIKSYFSDEEEYLRYSQLIDYYPSRMVEAKEYFYSYHNKILSEVAGEYLEDYYEKKSAKEKIEYRHNADFYLLNQELQAFEKLKQKIYAKSRKLNRTEEETKTAIENAFKQHKQRQLYLSKVLFKDARKQQLGATIKSEKVKNKILARRDSIDFYTDKDKTDIISRTYPELISETKLLFIEVLKVFDAYNDVCNEHKQDEPKKYVNQRMSIYTKLLDKKLIEPNLWNRFDDYCYMAFDKYPDGPTYLYQLNKYQTAFIEEFMRDIMCYWGEGTYVPPELNPILKNRKKIKKLKT